MTMSKQITHCPDHDEIMSLLPWYVNQTLDKDQRETVSSHVEHCGECQREIQLLTSLNEAVQNDVQNDYREHADIDKNLASVMSRIDANEHQVNTKASVPSLLKQKISELFTFGTAGSGVPWGATAVAGLLVAVLGFQLFNDQSDNVYSVLSSSEVDNAPMRLSVELTSSEDWEQARPVIQQKIDKLAQQVDIEMKTDGVYFIAFKDTVAVTELRQLILDFENEALIQRVELLP